MANKFGSTFGVELIAAGCNDGISWDSETGQVYGLDQLPADQQAKVQAVIAAHDPSAIDPAAHNAEIDAQIVALEVKQARPLREYTLAADDAGRAAALARIQEIDAEIVTLRAERITA